MICLNPQTNPDPFSWDYQTSIHGIAGTLNSTMSKLWNSGKDYAHNNTEFFLSWHRMYLYFFERIICKLTQNPNFRIPYWDPAANINLPASFQSNTLIGGITNHLYIASPNRNRTGLTASEVAIFNSTVQNAMNAPSYCKFLEYIETLHMTVHGAIGGQNNSTATPLGYMTQFEISPKDPIFFVFHSYIDRLWEQWLRQSNRKNPKGLFQTELFYFYNVKTGTTGVQSQLVKIKGSQVLNTSTKLKYTYQGVSGSPSTSKQKACCPPDATSARLLKSTSPITIAQNKTHFSLANTTIAIPLIEFGKLKTIGNNQTIYAEFDDVVINQMPKDLIAIYFVKENQTNATPQLLSFVGLVDILNTRMNHTDNNGKKRFRINITDIFRQMSLPLSSLKNTNLVFRPVNEEGSNTNLTGNISFSGITIVLETN